jgi:hypothetical protein
MGLYKRALFPVFITSFSLALTLISPAIASQKSMNIKPKQAGRVSTAFVNTILSGAQAPKPTDGIDGDFYIDTKTVNFYGPKIKGHWSSGVSLRGAPGLAGSDGKNGNDGRSGTNISAAGPPGTVGPIGLRGEVGPQGLTGAKGDTGSRGETGAKGETGVAGSAGGVGAIGPQGLPGSTGANGSPGSQGVAGSQGAAGSAGSAGAQGATGLSGTSKTFYGNIVFVSAIQGSIGSSQPSNTFGGFQAGKSYIMRIKIKTFNTTQNLSTYPISFAIAAQGASPTLFENYSVVAGSNWISGAKQDEVNIIADIAIDGSSVVTAYTFIVTITCGAATSVFPIALSGNYLLSEVSQVSVTS